MKKTRNLFLLVGAPEDILRVLESIQFKGVITNQYCNPIFEAQIEKVFANNKSVVSSAEDFVGKYPSNTFFINVVPMARPNACNQPQTIYVKDSESIANQFKKIADSLNLDIGDHKSNSSGTENGPTKSDCFYCYYNDNELMKNTRTIYRSKNFFVISTIGQFISGYLLIIPYQHVMSNGELSYEYLEEFENVLSDIEYILKLAYPETKNVLVWENGSGLNGKCKAKDSIVHSHVHIAPSNLTAQSIKDLSKFPFDEIVIKDLHKYKSHSYLLVRNQDKITWLINNNPEMYIPRQYVRQLLAEEYNIPGEEWNWRTYPFEEKMYETAKHITNILRMNNNQLPERIRNNTSFLFNAN